MSPPDSGTPRVLILIYSLARGGAERMTVEMARAWVEQGFDVTVVTVAGTEVDFFVLDPRAKRIALNLGSGSRKAVFLLWNNFSRILAIRRALKQITPEAALGMMSDSAILLTVAGFGLPGRRYGSERTYPPMLPLGLGKGALRTLAYGLLDGVVCQTNVTAAWVTEHTWARKATVAPNPTILPLPRLTPIIRISDLLMPDDRCLISVGRFDKGKQFDRLITTFTRLASIFPDWKLIILGDGQERATLKAQVDAAGLADRVQLPGPCGNIGDWYVRADLFVLTSRFEGFPNVLLEALAHGTPAIALDCPTGPADIIEHGRNGILVPADDFVGLEDALIRLMGNADLRAELAAGAPKVNSRFGRERVMNLWSEALGLPRTRVAA